MPSQHPVANVSEIMYWVKKYFLLSALNLTLVNIIGCPLILVLCEAFLSITLPIPGPLILYWIIANCKELVRNGGLP